MSLYNQYVSDDKWVAIHPTPTVGMVGVLPDITNRATSGFKREGDHIYLIGQNTSELGASEYLAVCHGLEQGRPPMLDLELEKAVQDAVVNIIQAGLCDTAHDCSEGGLAVALAEMVLAGGYGARLELSDDIRADALLFGEAASRIVIAVPDEKVSQLENLLQDVPFKKLGLVEGSSLIMQYPTGKFELGLEQLKSVYERPLKEALS